MRRDKDDGPLFSRGGSGPGIPDDELPPFNRGSDTSLAAAVSMRHARARQEAEVLRVIVASGQAGMTDKQIEAATGWAHEAVSARRNALMNKGLIHDVGRRLNPTGRSAVVWCARGRAPAAVSGE